VRPEVLRFENVPEIVPTEEVIEPLPKAA